MTALRYLACLLRGGHDWPAWDPWAHRSVDGVFTSQRTCRRCPRTAYWVDGTPYAKGRPRG
jgi:hypothetical protein